MHAVARRKPIEHSDRGTGVRNAADPSGSREDEPMAIIDALLDVVTGVVAPQWRRARGRPPRNLGQ